MFIYQVVREPYSEGGPECLGLFTDLEEAKNSVVLATGGVWTKHPSHGIDHRLFLANDKDYLMVCIYQWQLTMPSSPIHQFASAILSGDPVAIDAVRDILRV